MTDSLVIEGDEYISSRRAAKETGYTQDYIGQLCRGGHITARRVSGRWYVVLESLKAYKTKAESYKPQPPAPIAQTGDVETTLTFDGRDFVSAGLGAKLTGYNQDYVGQLARSGKIASRQIGNRWFIDKELLLVHKKEKDALLAEVQVESVGLHAPTADTTNIEELPSFPPSHPREPFYIYSEQKGHLLPPLLSDERPTQPIAIHKEPEPRATSENLAPVRSSAPQASKNESPFARHPIPIKQVATAPRSAAMPKHPNSAPIKKYHFSFWPFASLAVAVLIVIAFVFTPLREKAIYAIHAISGGSTQSASAEGASPLQSAMQWLEGIFAREITYTNTNL
jgi:hypothetical protein